MDVVVSTHTLRSRSPSPTQPMNGDGPHVASSALQINCDDGEYDFIVDEQVATRTARVIHQSKPIITTKEITILTLCMRAYQS